MQLSSDDWLRGCRKAKSFRIAYQPQFLEHFLVGGFNFLNFLPYLGKWSNLTNIFFIWVWKFLWFFMILSFRWSIYILTSNLLTTSTCNSCQDSIRAGAQSVAATVAWGWNCDGGGNIATLESQRWKKTVPSVVKIKIPQTKPNENSTTTSKKMPSSAEQFHQMDTCSFMVCKLLQVINVICYWVHLFPSCSRRVNSHSLWLVNHWFSSIRPYWGLLGGSSQ